MSGTALVVGSLAQIATQNNVSLAESFLNVDTVILVDTSGSMNECDSRGGQRRYDVALQELTRLQGDLPGRLAIISFSDLAQFAPSGVPPFLNGNTDLAQALRFARVADTGDIRFVVISDGLPDSTHLALAEAAQYRGAIDTVFVGPEGGHGAEFLARLAAASGGLHVTAARACKLAAKTEQLLLCQRGNGNDSTLEL